MDHSGHGGPEVIGRPCVAPGAPRASDETPHDHAGEDSLPAEASPVALDFERLYAEHFAFVWRSLRALGVPPDWVEDLAQDTFDVVLRQLGGFEGRASVRTWLFAIAQRVAANHRRTARRKLQPLRPLSDSAISHEPTPQAHAEASECAAVVERFVAKLEPELRTVFILAVLEQVPARDVALSLHIPVNTVYTRVHHLRDALRRAFERHEERS